MLHTMVDEPTGHHSATLIFLHGSGGAGVTVRSWIQECFARIGDEEGLQFKHIKVIYPTATPQPYTLTGGEPSNVWFDRVALQLEAQEARKSTDKMLEMLAELIQVEIDAGIPPSRIIIGGFSMGGSMSFHIGYRKRLDLGGIFAMSSFLYDDSAVYPDLKELKKKNSDVTMPELFMTHGTQDELVLFQWGRKTFEKLKELGVKGRFHASNQTHLIRSEELVLLKKWVLEKLPSNLISKL
ncbi:lysophospholipase-like protein 1 [Styela clava]